MRVTCGLCGAGLVVYLQRDRALFQTCRDVLQSWMWAPILEASGKVERRHRHRVRAKEKQSNGISNRVRTEECIVR